MTAPALTPAVPLAADVAEVVPEQLRAMKRWTAWQLVPPAKPGAKPGKKPLSRTNDSSTWSAFEDVLGGAGRHAGIGFQLFGISGLAGIDLDGCVDPATGSMSPFATALLDALPDTYAEITPSGKGLRLFATVPEGLAVPEFLSQQHGVECYVGKSARYLTVTGRALPGRAAKLSPITPAAIALLAPLDTKAATVSPGADVIELPTARPSFDLMPEARHADLARRAAATPAHLAFINEGAPRGARSEMLWAVTRALLESGVSPEEAFSFLRSSRGIWRYALAKRHNVEKRALDLLWSEVQRAARNEAPAAAEEPPPAAAEGAGDSAGFVLDIDAEIAALNEQHFIAAEGGKVRVYAEHDDPQLRRRVLVRYQYEDFARKFSHRWWWEGQGRSRRRVQLGRTWLESPKARRYDEIVFDPSGRTHRPDVLNLWRGFAVEPRRGDWSVLYEHIRDVVCGGDEGHAAYTVGWLARLIQRPNEPGEVAIVLRGREGVGKGLFARMILRIFGQHGLQVSQAGHVVGHFNAHLKDCVFLFADEAFFAGDRQHASVLKSLITEPWMMIEPKGIDPYPAANLLHVVMATNSRWAVPAGLDARRFAVFDVSDARREDRAYFHRLGAAIDDDAILGAMLWDLQRHDLSTFEVRDLPKTAALDDQKCMSLEGCLAWLRDVLAAGSLTVGEDMNALHAEWREFYSTAELHASFERWRMRQRYERPLAANMFARDLKRIFGASVRAPAKYADVVTNRARCFWLGPLATARTRFCEATGLGEGIFEAQPDESDEDLSDVLG